MERAETHNAENRVPQPLVLYRLLDNVVVFNHGEDFCLAQVLYPFVHAIHADTRQAEVE